MSAPSRHRWLLTPPLLELVRRVEGVPTNQETFTYHELVRIVTSYILADRGRFIDDGNVHIVNIGNDPVCRAAFGGMRAFHRGQLGWLLRQRLRPLDSDRAKKDNFTQTVGEQ